MIERNWRSGLVGTLLVVSAIPAIAQTTLSIGAAYATGDYGFGGDDVEDVYAPVTLDVKGERFLFSLTVPYASIDGPEGSVWVSDTFLPGDGPTVSEQGLGDVIASLTALNVFESSDGSVVVDLTGTIKFGTADEEDGLGTGENDYAAQVDVYRLFDRGTLFANGGYKVRGDPDYFDLDDTWFVSAGGVYRISAANSLGAMVSHRPEVIWYADDATDLTVFAGHRFVNGWRMDVHALAGLSDGSPDWGAGFRVRMPL